MAFKGISTTQLVVLVSCVVVCLSQGFKTKDGFPGVKKPSLSELNEEIPRPNKEDNKTFIERALKNENVQESSPDDSHIQKRDIEEGRLKPIDIARHISLDDYLKEERNNDRPRRSTEMYDVDTSKEDKLSRAEKKILKALRREQRMNEKPKKGKKKGGKKNKKKPGGTGTSGGTSGGRSGGEVAIFGYDEENSWPMNYGTDLDVLAADHVRRKLRAGQATTTDSCSYIRSVPSSLKSESNFIPKIDGNHYVKYTEAYGIPVIGSRNVSDHGLKRACYLLKLMYADRYDTRNWYYKNFGRFALIGDREEQTDLPEYTRWDPNKWDDRARGLGPTSHTPTTSCGDDNQRCKAGDRYFDQDIGTHELGHAIEQLGLYVAIPAFKTRLKALYDAAIRARKYGTKYASTNPMEYFAVTVQFYFNSFRGSSYSDLNGHTITDRNSLRKYDPKLVELLDEVFPCSKRYNTIIHRCKWKECTSKNWKIRYYIKDKAKSTCKNIRSSYSRKSLDDCLQYACYFGANTVNYKPKYCHVLKCDSIQQDSHLKLTQTGGEYNIYTIADEPQADLKEEFQQKIRQLCTRGPEAYRCQLSSAEKKICSGTTSVRICRGMGCCFISGKCYFPKQDCTDKSVLCTELVRQKECSRNPNFMWRHCPLSCGVCNSIRYVDQAKLLTDCQDKNVHCLAWGKGGECKKNPIYMNNTCPVYCGRCRPSQPKVNRNGR